MPWLLFTISVVFVGLYFNLTTGLDVVAEPQKEDIRYASLKSPDGLSSKFRCPSSSNPRVTIPSLDEKCQQTLKSLKDEALLVGYVERKQSNVIVELKQSGASLYTPADTLSLRNKKIATLAIAFLLFPAALLIAALDHRIRKWRAT